MTDVNVCKHFKVGYGKYGLKCRHKNIKEECNMIYCNKKCQNRHIKLVCIDGNAKGKMNANSNTMKKINTRKLFRKKKIRTITP